MGCSSSVLKKVLPPLFSTLLGGRHVKYATAMMIAALAAVCVHAAETPGVPVPGFELNGSGVTLHDQIITLAVSEQVATTRVLLSGPERGATTVRLQYRSAAIPLTRHELASPHARFLLNDEVVPAEVEYRAMRLHDREALDEISRVLKRHGLPLTPERQAVLTALDTLPPQAVQDLEIRQLVKQSDAGQLVPLWEVQLTVQAAIEVPPGRHTISLRQDVVPGQGRLSTPEPLAARYCLEDPQQYAMAMIAQHTGSIDYRTYAIELTGPTRTSQVKVDLGRTARDVASCLSGARERSNHVHTFVRAGEDWPNRAEFVYYWADAR